MSRGPRDYQTLRDDHTRALETLDQHIAQPAAPEHAALEPSAERQPEAEPTRPENTHPTSRGWTGMGDMASQQASANNYNTLIIADLAERNQDQGQDLGATETPSQGTEMNREGAEDRASAWLENDDGTVTEISGQPTSDRADAADRVQQYIDQGEGSARQSEFQDTAREVLDNHIDSEPPDIKIPEPPGHGQEVEI